MGAEGSESDDDMYVTCTVTVPSREGRTWQLLSDNIPVSRLFTGQVERALGVWLDEVRADLELGDRTS